MADSFLLKLLKLESNIRQQGFFAVWDNYLSRKLTIIALNLLLNLSYWSVWLTRFDDLKSKNGNLPFLLKIKMILRIWGWETLLQLRMFTVYAQSIVRNHL